MRLLLTRAETDAERTAARLRARAHTVVIAPLLRIEPIADAPLGVGPWAALLVTSANAAPAIARHENKLALAAIPVFAVGERSAQAMREAGFADVTASDGGVAELGRFVAAWLKPGLPLLYLAGEDRSGDLAGDLRSHGFTVHTVVIYRAVVAAALPVAAAEALAGGVDGVLHFSRRSVETFITVARDAGLLAPALAAAHFCLSAQVAEPLLRAGARAVRVAAQPSEDALIGLVGVLPH